MDRERRQRKDKKDDRPAGRGGRKINVLSELKKISDANGGRLLARDVVNAARSPKHPLHSRFDWNDATAAENWRIEQAWRLIRIHWKEVEQAGLVQRVPVFTSTHPVTGTKGYEDSEEVSGEEIRQLAVRDLEAWGTRYRGLLALHGYIIADDLVSLVGLAARPAKQRRRKAAAA